MDSIEEELAQLILDEEDVDPMICEEKRVINQCNNNNSNSSNNSKITTQEHKYLIEQMRQKKLQILARREPTNVLILENIEQSKSQSIQSMLLETDSLQSSFSILLSRYIKMLHSLILVFEHRDEAQLCKLLIQRQNLIDISQIFIYFGKALSNDTIQKHQLLPPFPTRQFLISPPLSPPGGWAPEGDGLEQAPKDVVDPQELSDRLRRVIYQDNTSNGFPSITLEFCT
eukprot:gene3340-4187_t